MIILHHLVVSQSERIVWLLEELEVPYKLIKHTRDPLLAPGALKDVPGNKTSKAPFIEDTDAEITLSESGAISDYIIYRHGNHKLAPKASESHFADYLYWYHFANASQQATFQVSMFLELAGVPDNGGAKEFADERLRKVLEQTDERLMDNKWLAGSEFTAADIMSVYGLTTQRYYGPRDSYKRALQAGDPDMKPLIGPDPPPKSFFPDGVDTDHWKK